MSLLRLRNDFRFAIISLFGVIAVVVILPFAIYRFANGQFLAGSVDFAIVVGLVAGVTYAWRGGNIDRIAHVLVIFILPAAWY